MVVIEIIILKFQDLHWSGNICYFLLQFIRSDQPTTKVHLELIKFYLFIMSNMNYYNMT